MYAQTRGGGNCANALTAAARLGLEPHLVSKVGADSIGEEIEQELLSDGVQTNFLLKATDHPSPFTYIIVDKQGANLLVATSNCYLIRVICANSCKCAVLHIRSCAVTLNTGNAAVHQLCEKALLDDAGGTRTCIHTPGASYAPEDLDQDTIDRILSNAQLAYFDGRLTESAVVLARAARKRGIPVLVEAERLRPTLEVLLQEADYVCTSAHFPQVDPPQRVFCHH